MQQTGERVKRTEGDGPETSPGAGLGALAAGLLESSPMGVIVVDRDLQVLLWNEVMKSTTGIGPEAVVGTDLRSVFPELARERYLLRLEAALESGAPVVFHGSVHRGLLRMGVGEAPLCHHRTTCRRLSAADGTPLLALWVENTTLLDETVEYLRSEIATRKQAEEELESIASSRAVLYRELQHRVKNSLALISSLVALTRGQTADQHTSDVLAEIDARISAIAMVYHELSAAPRYGELDLSTYLERLVGAIMDSVACPYGLEDPELDLERCMMPVDTAVSLGLIVNELVTNSVKHAFPHGCGGRIGVVLRAHGDGAELIVRDDGVGFGTHDDASGDRSDGAAGDASSDTPGRAPDHGGLGLGLIEVLARQIGATLEPLDGPGVGHRIAVPAPDPPDL